MTTVWYIFLVVVAVAIVATCVIRAVTRSRTPQGAFGWVLFLLTAPWFAVPAYVLFGHHKLREYNEARQRSRELRTALVNLAADHPAKPAAARRLSALERLVELPVVGGNRADLLIDGTRTFEAMFMAIDAAMYYVCAQFYTIADDDLGGEFADRLIAAAERGVTVFLIYDGVGSYALPKRYLRRLTDAGVRVVDPDEARGPTFRLQINFRNHRKTLIVDGVRGFVGGHNVSDTYVGRNEKIGHWRDTHVALKGPMVSELQLAFMEDWHWATGETLGHELSWQAGLDPADMSGLIVPTGPGDIFDSGALFFFTAIAEARERVWIASPYFVPDVDVISALNHAALKGCDVRVIVPERPDHYLTWLAAFAYFDEVRHSGVRIFRYGDGFMHQKVLLIDGDFAGVGTANLDNRSFRLNFETMAVIHDERFARDVETMLKSDLEKSREVDEMLPERGIPLRVGALLARLLAPVL
jgi:cardiolipin synthase